MVGSYLVFSEKSKATNGEMVVCNAMDGKVYRATAIDDLSELKWDDLQVLAKWDKNKFVYFKYSKDRAHSEAEVMAQLVFLSKEQRSLVLKAHAMYLKNPNIPVCPPALSIIEQALAARKEEFEPNRAGTGLRMQDSPPGVCDPPHKLPGKPTAVLYSVYGGIRPLTPAQIQAQRKARL